MPHLGWKDPEMMLVERWLVSVGEHGPTLAAQYSEKLPVVALMDVHRVQAEATNTDEPYIAAWDNNGSIGRICKALDLDIIRRPG